MKSHRETWRRFAAQVAPQTQNSHSPALSDPSFGLEMSVFGCRYFVGLPDPFQAASNVRGVIFLKHLNVLPCNVLSGLVLFSDLIFSRVSLVPQCAPCGDLGVPGDKI